MLNPEDDIENIYRDFAENYPLKADTGDWDDFEQKMDAAMPGKPAMPGRPVLRFLQKNKYYAAAIVLLLAYSVLHFSMGSSNAPKTLTATAKNGNKNNTGANNAKANTGNALQNNANKEMGADSIKLTHEDASPVPGNKAVANTADGYKTSKGPAMINKGAVTAKTVMTTGAAAKGSVAGSKQPISQQPADAPTASQQQNTFNSAGALAPAGNNPVSNTVDVQSNNGTNNMQTPAAKNMPAKNAVAAGKKNSIQVKAFKKYFYAAALAGPDFSTVRFQNTSNSGLSFGIMAGYQVSKNISVEMGVLADRKNYFSSGKYFDKRSVRLSNPDDKIQSVNGIGSLIEVPLTVRLNVYNKGRNTLFVTTGLSSYFMKKEKYELAIQHVNGLEKIDADNDDWCANLFSLLHVSAGYQYRLNTHNTVQMEPYFKVPFSGIGKSALPITSGGVYIRFTHSFFK